MYVAEYFIRIQVIRESNSGFSYTIDLILRGGGTQAKNALVFMVVADNVVFKVPIGYFLVVSMTRQETSSDWLGSALISISLSQQS